MDTNDLNRRIRYAFMLDDQRVIELLALGDWQATPDDVIGWRLKQGDEQFVECPAASIDALLNGLISDRRGPRSESEKTAGASAGKPEQGTPDTNRIDNNRILKQLRIALTLRTEEVHQLISEGGGKLGVSEVNALFRKPSARNFRRCGDQVLRWFLAGLGKSRNAEDADQA